MPSRRALATRMGGLAESIQSAPVAYTYSFTHSPWLRRLVVNLLGLVGLPRALRVDGPAGMETVLTEQGERWLLHLVPRATESVESHQVATHALVHGVKVRVRKPDVKEVTCEPEGSTLPFRHVGECVEVDVPAFGEWTILAFK